MFSIEIKVADKYYSGCNALDKCRQFGLEPEVTNLYIKGKRWFDVDEGFARAYFSPSETNSSETIPVDMLRKGELTILGQNTGLAEMSVERAKELFVVARFVKLQRELDKARAAAVLGDDKDGEGEDDDEGDDVDYESTGE